MSNTPISSIDVEKVVNVNKNLLKVFKVIVVGDTNVGKTSLTYRFCEGQFLDAPEATIGVDFRERSLEIDGEVIKLQLWDTAGQERFRKSMVQHYYRNVHAVIFVYDVTSLASFQSLKQWIEEVDKHSFTDVPRILVGNKCDQNVAVNTNLAQWFADQYNMPFEAMYLEKIIVLPTSTFDINKEKSAPDLASCKLFETSARLDSHCDNVEAIFLTLAHKLKNQKPMIPKPVAISITNTGSSNQKSGCC